MIDVIVVGSGPGGANAAVPLVEAGLNVVLLDVGADDTRYTPLIPAESFRTIREIDDQQHRYFLGDDFEGIPFGKLGLGAQLTPPRRYVFTSAASRMPTESSTFQLSESLALSGLGAAWGAGVFPFSEKELSGWSISRADLDPHYRAVAERIGTTAGRGDDLEQLLGGFSTMPPIEIDTNAEAVLHRYSSRRDTFAREGFFLGRTPLAICTEALHGRGPHKYLDMDFWADTDRSVYRPRFTIEELRPRPNFSYEGQRFVQSFTESAEGVEVTADNTESGARQTYRARALVLAGGTTSSARIVLRSLGRYTQPLPLLCNPYTYVPAVNLRMIGRPARDRRHSLAQLTGLYAPPGREHGMVVTQMYSYRSLMTFKLLKEAPIAYREALRVMQLLTSAFAILGINHEDTPSVSRNCRLERGADGSDRLVVSYQLSTEEESRHARDEAHVIRFFRRLGCWPIKAIRPGHGSSIHYAGTFPMAADGGELTCNAECRLRATRAVYVADGSPFPYLPAKGLTFTIMANANRVGSLLAEKLASSGVA
ncbi:MAG: GMC oxidoreductase [Pseudomonadota bacterium]|nr:GMC oxidoreductase [Pseudomonadota bacterium]